MPDIEVIEKIEETVKVHIPSMYKVLLHNDDKTTMDFVVVVLTQIFHRSVEDAINITMQIHHTDRGVAGSPYTKEIAEEKVLETISLARANGFPLAASYEEM
jgi:ATP-dependent Clp protease adaptor protein ClpS